MYALSCVKLAQFFAMALLKSGVSFAVASRLVLVYNLTKFFATPLLKSGISYAVVSRSVLV